MQTGSLLSAVYPFAGRRLIEVVIAKARLVIYFHVFPTLLYIAVCAICDGPMAFAKHYSRWADTQLRPQTSIWMSALDHPRYAEESERRARETDDGRVVNKVMRLTAELHQKLADAISALATYTAIKQQCNANAKEEQQKKEKSRRWRVIKVIAKPLNWRSDYRQRAWVRLIADQSLARRAFSLDNLKELDALLWQLLSNLKLSVFFFSGDVAPAPSFAHGKFNVFALLIAIFDRSPASANVQALKPVRTKHWEIAAAPELAVLFGHAGIWLM